MKRKSVDEPAAEVWSEKKQAVEDFLIEPGAEALHIQTNWLHERFGYCGCQFHGTPYSDLPAGVRSILRHLVYMALMGIETGGTSGEGRKSN